jgi:hypothetical protein
VRTGWVSASGRVLEPHRFVHCGGTFTGYYSRVKLLRIVGAILIMAGAVSCVAALVASSGTPNCGPGYSAACPPSAVNDFYLVIAGFMGFAIGLVMIVVSTLVIASRKRKEREAEDIQFMQSASMATGVVTAMRDTGQTVNDDPLAEIAISYTRLDGNPAQATVTQIVPRLAVPRPGDPATVWYDTSGPKVVAKFVSPAVGQPTDTDVREEDLSQG